MSIIMILDKMPKQYFIIYLFLSDIWHTYKSIQFKNKSFSVNYKYRGSATPTDVQCELKWVEKIKWNAKNYSTLCTIFYIETKKQLFISLGKPILPKNVTHINRFPKTANDCNLWKSVSWHTLSKAFAKSMYATATVYY